MKFDNFTEDEIAELTVWAIKMIKFWFVSALLYIAIFYHSTLAFWVLGSLVVLKATDYWLEVREKGIDDDKDN